MNLTVINPCQVNSLLLKRGEWAIAKREELMEVQLEVQEKPFSNIIILVLILVVMEAV